MVDLPPKYWHLVVKNGNFTFLMLEFILADQLADLTPPQLASSGQGWQFYISTVTVHIGRSTGRSTPKVQCIMGCILWDVFGSHCGFFKERSSGRSTPQYWHLVVKNGNFTFLL